MNVDYYAFGFASQGLGRVEVPLLLGVASE